MSQENGSLENSTLAIPAFGKSPALSLDMSKTREGEKRIIEAKTVSPATYSELEYTYNEAYRELVKNNAAIGYQITLAEKALEDAKAAFLLDKYEDLIKDKPKSFDNADIRKAYLMRDPEYTAALDRINMLKAFESFTTGRIKVFERVCSYMKKRMDLLIRSGLSGTNMYVTNKGER